MRNGIRWLRLTGTALILTASLGVARPATALAAPSQSGTITAGPFVALGDSYAAGNLIPASPSGTPVDCLRSSHATAPTPPRCSVPPTSTSPATVPPPRP